MPPAPTPWHQVVALKPELRTGELSLSQFAADLHEVVSRAGRRPLYEDPEKFFALTYEPARQKILCDLTPNM